VSAPQLRLLPDPPGAAADRYRGLPPFEAGSATSRAAALALFPYRPTMQERVYDFILACGDWGATSDEAEIALHGLHQSVSARIRELVQAGLLVKARFTRDTSSHHEAVVYLAVPITAARRAELFRKKAK
jgi:hypothetical protein